MQRFLYGFPHRDLGVQGRCGVLLNNLHLPEMFFPGSFPPIDRCAIYKHGTAAWPLQSRNHPRQRCFARTGLSNDCIPASITEMGAQWGHSSKQSFSAKAVRKRTTNLFQFNQDISLLSNRQAFNRYFV